MASPSIVWRNPKANSRRRLWNRARKDGKLSVYIVVRSGGGDSEWEGMPNLEVVEGSGPNAAHQSCNARSGR